MINIGVVGYSDAKFDEGIAKCLLHIAFDIIEQNHPSKKYTVVSGLTDMGIPAIAYRLASKCGWKTVGVACSKANDYDCYDVDEKIIVGDDWGDESDTFLDKIDVLIRVGGGEQSFKECKTAKDKKNIQKVYEFDLPKNK